MKKSQGIIEYIIISILIVAFLIAGISIITNQQKINRVKEVTMEERLGIHILDNTNLIGTNTTILKKVIEYLDEVARKSLKMDKDILSAVKNNQDRIIERHKKSSYEELKSHVVFIEAQSTPIIMDGITIKSSEAWIGTGFVIRASDRLTYIVTNAHVAGQGRYKPKIKIGDTDDEMKNVIYIDYHDKYDLAILIVDGTFDDKTPIKGITDANYSQRLQVVGHHLGRKYIYGEGVYAGVETEDMGHYGLEFDVYQLPTLYGNSGSPVFNQDEEVVGVIFAINGYNFFGGMDTAHGLAVPGKILKQFIEEVL